MTVIVIFLALGGALIVTAGWLLRWQTTPDAFVFWRKWSTWFAGLNAALWASLTANTGMLLGFIGFIPQRFQIPAVAFVFVICWALPVIIAHIKQPKLEVKVAEKIEEKANASGQ